MRPDRDVDRELRELGPHVEYPPVPDLTGTVRGRLETEAGGAGSPARSGPRLWWIAAAALVLLVAVPVFSLAVREMGGGVFSGSGGMAAGGGAGESGGRDAVEGGQSGAGGVAEQEDPSSMAGAKASPSADPGSSAAACFSREPSLEVEPSRGAPGDGFGIQGKNFDGNLRDCDDDPARDVRVEFLQDGRTWELGRLVSDKDSRLAASLAVPADARPGRAIVRATYGQGPPEDPYGRASAEARFYVTE